MKKLLSVLLTGILLLTGCAETAIIETDTAETITTPETEITADESALMPAKHEITVADVSGIFAANEMSVKDGNYYPYQNFHGGQQMRVVHTERGTYAAFLKHFNVSEYNPSYTGYSELYLTKVDTNGENNILLYDEYDSYGKDVELNIALDTNGNVVAVTMSPSQLITYIIDAETDEVSAYKTDRMFANPERSRSDYPGPMFDFENRKVYMFACGDIHTFECVFEWYTFDLETNQWLDSSIEVAIPGLGRHCYPQIYPDGNGGAYIVAVRTLNTDYIADLLATDKHPSNYVWDELTLFHIPDLTVNEISYTTIQKAVTDRGMEGIWSNIAHAGIDTHMDSKGNIHITYGSSLIGGDPYVTLDRQNRHAVYSGMECIFNEEFSMPITGKTHIRQDSDGNLYMIESQSGAWDDDIMYIRIYKADDVLGRTWTLVKENTIEGMKMVSLSINSHRSCPVQDDNIFSCFMFGSTPNSFTRGTLFDSTAYVFNLSLEDYAITEPVDMLAGYDLTLDTIITYPAHGASHQNKVVHTENGTYAVLSTEYKKDHEYLSYNWADYETFQIIKIEDDNTAKILYTDTYSCSTDLVAQSMYMNIKKMPDGLIYVSPPSGFFLYVIDPSTDEVTVQQPTEVWNYTKQSDFFVDGNGDTRVILATIPGFLRQTMVLDTTAWKYGNISRAYNGIRFDTKTTVPAAGAYSNFYTVEDGNGGVYYVGTRYITPEDTEDAGLSYSGYTNKIDDSIALFHIPDLTQMKNNTFVDICLPYVEQGDEGIWSVVNVESAGDVYLDSEGQLHIFYTYYLFDFDDTDRRGNPEMVANTFKRYHAIYKDGEVISTEELGIDLSRTAAVRMAETTDGTDYLLVCNLGEEGAKIDVYFETESGWALTQTKTLGEFTAESFSISSPRGGSVQDNVIDCIVYANDNDVYFTSVTFE